MEETGSWRCCPTPRQRTSARRHCRALDFGSRGHVLSGDKKTWTAKTNLKPPEISARDIQHHIRGGHREIIFLPRLRTSTSEPLSLPTVFLRYKDPATGEQKQEPVTINELLLRGCAIRNTAWIIGVVVFTGADTKIMLNGGDTPSKRSKIEKENQFQRHHQLCRSYADVPHCGYLQWAGRVMVGDKHRFL